MPYLVGKSYQLAVNFTKIFFQPTVVNCATVSCISNFDPMLAKIAPLRYD
jgi:hypothetical protein